MNFSACFNSSSGDNGGSSSGGSSSSDAEVVAMDVNDLKIIFGGNDTSDSVTQNITLPLYGDRDTDISWVSSDDNVIYWTENNIGYCAINGSVKRPEFVDGDSIVTLTANVSKGGVTNSKIFLLTVKRKPGTDAQSVQDDLNNLQIQYADGDNANRVTQNVFLETEGNCGSAITWSSDNGSTLSIDGVVSRPPYGSGNIGVVLTATVSKGSVSETKVFNLTVFEMPPSDEEAVAEDIAALQVIFAAGDTYTKVTQNVTLNTAGSNETTITWSSGNGNVLSTDGIINRPASNEDDVIVLLTATVSKGSVSEEKEFSLIIKKIPIPGIPVITSAAVKNEAVVIRWLSVMNASEYKVYYSTVNNFSQAVLFTGDSDTRDQECEIDELTNETLYYFWVTSIEESFEGQPGNSISAMPREYQSIPGSVSDVQIVKGASAVQVTWEPVNGADTYSVYFSTTNDFSTATEVDDDVVASDTECNINSLVSGTAYYLWVVAENTLGTGPVPTEPVMFTVSNDYSFYTSILCPRVSRNNTITCDIDDDGDVDIIMASYYYIIWFENDGMNQYEKRIINTSSDFYPGYVKCLDVDSDGDKDLIVGEDGQRDKIAILENNGNQSFTQKIIIDSVFRLDTMEIGDLNNDGYFDIVATSGGSGYTAFMWFKNNGNNSFTRINILTGSAPASVDVYDVDMDGDYDLVCGFGTNDIVAWFRNNGSGSFSRINLSTDSGYVTSVGVGDFDNDGDIDIVARNTWYVNNNNSFTKRTLDTYYGEYHACDFDHDGDTDLIVSNGWLENTGSSTLQFHEFTIDGNIAQLFDVVDIDFDGDYDIISSSSYSNLSLLINEDQSNFTTNEFLIRMPSNFDMNHFIEFGDMDNDGDMDFVVYEDMTPEIRYYEKLQSNMYKTHVLSLPYDPMGGIPSLYSLNLYDYNNDGKLDIFAAGNDGVVYYKNEGNNSFSTNMFSEDYVYSRYAAFNFKDYDNDGDTDIYLGKYIFENDGSDSFARTEAITDDLRYAEYLDADLDGDIDIVGVISNTQLVWYENNGNNSFTKRSISSSVGSIRGIKVINCDNDGDEDIFIWSGSGVFRILNNGNKTFSISTIVSDYFYQKSVAFSDISGDGFVDVIIAQNDYVSPNYEARFYVYENNGSGSFTSKLVINENNNQNQEPILYCADFNNDGVIDIYSISRYGGASKIYYQIP